VSDPASLTSSAVEIPEGETATAVILDDASSPDDLIRAATVTDPDHALNPMPWSPVSRASGLYYPKKGDTAIVVFPEEGDEAIVLWTPLATSPDAMFTGPEGPQGPEGKQGPKGDTGAAGPEGPKGSTGATGATGAKGERGEKGETGATGAKGAEGGTGFIRGSVSSAGAVVAGSGFSVERTATGTYKITLTTELATAGILVGNAVNLSALVSPEAATSKKIFVALVLTPGTGFTNAAFNFVVMPT
jgi:hypothetical protein